MAKTNFQYEKRQKELEKKRKADEKAKRKLEAKNNPKLAEDGTPEEPDADADGEDGDVEEGAARAV